MLEIRGKYNTAHVFTDTIDAAAVSQLMELCNQTFCKGSVIRIMPDVHAGKGCTIGTTMTLNGTVVPNLVGVDIGCGMELVRLRETELDFEALDRVIRGRIPSGFAIHAAALKAGRDVAQQLKALRCAEQVDLDRAARSVGTLGGGNHFIEVDRDEEGYLYLTVHSGSRHLGVEVCGHYQRLAIQNCTGRAGEFVPKELAWVEGPQFDDYIHDMRLAQMMALRSRQTMVDIIVSALDLHVEDAFTTIHNYIDTDHMILRKGSVSARAGERLLIPINMRDGSLICTGKGNPDWNWSAPHGAGRLMSRSEAKELFSVEEYAAEMAGIFTTSVGRGTLDECPMAYKDMAEILSNIGPTVTVDKIIKPVYNFKAS